MHGAAQDGLSQKGEGTGQASYYYSFTRLKPEGVLQTSAGAFEVEGISWMDHEFSSSQLTEAQVGWDWLSVQLANNYELMLYRMRHKDGSIDPYSSGTLVRPDGTSLPLRREDVQVQTHGQWQSPKSGAVYPQGWTIRIPAVDLTVSLEPVLAAQELSTDNSTRVTYWEGSVSVRGSMQGQATAGVGYVELTGYVQRVNFCIPAPVCLLPGEHHNVHDSGPAGPLKPRPGVALLPQFPEVSATVPRSTLPSATSALRSPGTRLPSGLGCSVLPLHTCLCQPAMVHMHPTASSLPTRSPANCRTHGGSAMHFEEILDQALAMLQRRRRVTYSTLRLQFQLDDEQLAALKDELLYSQPHVVDDAGRGLVWTGDTDTTPDLSPSAQLPVPAESPPGQTAQDAPAPVAPRSADAERRQLTVMFCDLVDSTRLSGQLDPEDYREVVRAYQAACTEVIQRCDGYIAQHLGDGLLVYFGYPQAHEDDARRAVRAGLGIVGAMATLNAHLEQRHGMRVAVRLGIHTGLVVVGEVGSGGRQENLALGETPNMAARIQGLAAPDTVVISAATFRLVQGYFTSEPLGAHPLKGVAAPVHVYRILGESGVQSRLEAVAPTRLSPLVGREEEVALLQRRWAQATTGLGQVVLLSGEAGIGKSRLVQVLKDHVTHEPYALMEWRGSPYHQQSTLYPVIDHLYRLLQWHQGAPPSEKLHTLEATLSPLGLVLSEVVPLLAALLSLPLPASYPPLALTPQRQRQQTLDTLLAWLLAEAQRQPILLVVEDLQWVDPSTLELLSLLIDQGAQARLCLVLTARPEFHPPWTMVAHLTALTLRRCAPAQIERLATHVAGNKALPPAVLQEVIRKTDGVPLFVEELTKTVLESGLLREQADHYELPGPLLPLAIPATLHDALMARLDRLGTVKVVAQLGATIGRTFAYELLQAVSPLDTTALQGALAQLVEAELVAQRGLPPQATYTFKHALIQDAAYQSLLQSTRQQYHHRIAQVLEERFRDIVEVQPEVLAYHYAEAGLYQFTRGLDYAAIVATSEKVAWTVDEIFRDRRFDVSKHMIPDSWVRTQHLEFLDAQEQRTLNHLRAFSYAHLFGNFEEFIPLHLTGLAQQDWHADRAHLRALLRFGEEEMKHQQLFRRAEAVLEASCGYPCGRYFDPNKDRVTAFTNAVLAYSPLPRALMLLAFEWGSQRHYVESVRDHPGERSDPLYVDVLKYHWIEENQHTKIGPLEIAQLARGMSPGELSTAFDHVQGIGGLADAAFVGQVDQELATFQTVTGRILTETEARALRDALYQSMCAIWTEVSLTHPSFKRVALELSKEGAAKLGIA